MATNTEHAPNAGSMSPQDMAEHVRTWNGFLTLVKWVIIGMGLVLFLLAVFRTHG